MTAPVIAIDGPAASGKGTVAERVAARLGFHYLDSGALYRLVALAAARAGIDPTDAPAVAAIAAALDVRFAGGRIRLAGDDVTEAIRAEAVGANASIVAALPAVRAALVDRQRAFRAAPGLVADGRDMGSAIFPDAALKIFLTASAEVRAERRYKQLMGKGIGVNMAEVLKDIRERDARDSARAAAPLRQCPDAFLLDTSNLSIEAAVDAVLHRYPTTHD